MNKTAELTKDQCIISWDTGELISDEVKFRLKEDNPNGLTEDEMFKFVCEDPFMLQDQWDWVEDELTVILRERNPDGNWKAGVSNFGWRKMNGSKEFHAENGQEFLRTVLPDCDCTFFIYDKGDGKLSINNFHHDSMWGDEWYYISPVKAT